MPPKALRDLWPVLIFPAVIIYFTFLFRSASGPFWQFADPSYIYLLNSIQIFKGFPPVDVSHPGTPLQSLIAASIWLFNIGHSTQASIDQAFSHPEFYLYSIFILFVIGTFATSVLLGAYIYSKTKDYIAAFLGQLTGFSFLLLASFNSPYILVLPVISNVSPEPLFIIIMNLFNLIVLRLYFSKDEKQVFQNTLLLGIICGLGFATKINFIFVLIAGFLLVPWRKKLIFGLACLSSFICFTLPIISKYPQFWQLITDMVDHTSRYGKGDNGLIDWNLYSTFIKMIIYSYRYFVFSALILFVWGAVGFVRQPKERAYRFIFILALCCILHALATAKYFSFHYLLPALALFGSIWPLFYLHNRDRYKISRPLAVVFILIYLGTCVFYGIPYYQGLKDMTTNNRAFTQYVSKNYPMCNVIPTRTVNVNFFINQQEALHRADVSAIRLEADDLKRLYPNSYYFYSEDVSTSTKDDAQIESYGIWDYEKRVWADDIINSTPCALFVKYPTDFSNYPYQTQVIYKSKYLNAYSLNASTEKAANEFFNKTLTAFKMGDYKKAFEYGMISKQLNYRPWGQLEYIQTLLFKYLCAHNSQGTC